MQAMTSASGTRMRKLFVLIRTIAAFVSLLLPFGCARAPDPDATRDVTLYQAWQLQRDDTVGDRRVLGGLGDISIALGGNSVYAPFDGRTQIDKHQCLLFSSPDVPAYLFRLCGLDKPQPSTVNRGDVIGSGDVLQFAALRKQPNGTWAIVEPSKTTLESTLKKP